MMCNISDRYPCGNYAKPLVKGGKLAQKGLEGRLPSGSGGARLTLYATFAAAAPRRRARAWLALRA